jgi:hypothetical protein
LRKLNHVEIAEDGKTAKIGGGASVKEVVDALDKAGKRTGQYPAIPEVTCVESLRPRSSN